MNSTFKTVVSVLVCLAVTGLLWLWTAQQFNRGRAQTARRFSVVQAHENDALQRILCYLERRTLRSRLATDQQKVQSLRTLDQIDRVGHLTPCTNLPKLAN